MASPQAPCRWTASEQSRVTISLRPHHLLCLLTYIGKGYTPAFTANFDAVVDRLNGGEDVLMVDGPDDICAPMLEDGHHCFNSGIIQRDAQAAMDVETLLGVRIAAGERLSLDLATVRSMREGFASGATRQACLGCQWTALCTDIAGRDFRAVRLSGAEPCFSRLSSAGIRPD